ncbi:hypothetical protein BV25DRAFT_1842830 [Artomyces pyxidatus]|uniref:Uncharacterized protein n=1 Tax=Artomyces pyxidatus TaxID=48021 RepID=A0ACB8SGS2_9AGAM|nr:hypothetical protein BV25DRAFT_1842830 [Artomyces pyxidatus]
MRDELQASSFKSRKDGVRFATVRRHTLAIVFSIYLSSKFCYSEERGERRLGSLHGTRRRMCREVEAWCLFGFGQGDLPTLGFPCMHFWHDRHIVPRDHAMNGILKNDLSVRDRQPPEERQPFVQAIRGEYKPSPEHGGDHRFVHRNPSPTDNYFVEIPWL